MKKIALLLAVLMTVSCIKEKTEPVPEEFKPGIMILDEGNYMSSNADITGYDSKSMESVTHYFSTMAGASEQTMGDSPTCIYSYAEYCYITMSGSGKIYVFRPDNNRIVDIITGLSSPRYLCGYGSSLWVSDLYNPSLIRIDLRKNVIADTVEIGGNAEMLIPYDKYIYTNFWNMDNTIAKLDAVTGEVLETLEVGIQPYSMELDNKNGILWVYCDGGGWDGNPAGFEDPSLYKIDISKPTMSIIKKIVMPRTDGYTFKLAMWTDRNGKPVDDYIYLINKHVYKMNRSTAEMPSTPFIDGTGKTFYSIAVSLAGDIYLTDAKDYVSDGECLRYDLFGSLIDSFPTGISPGFIHTSK